MIAPARVVVAGVANSVGAELRTCLVDFTALMGCRRGAPTPLNYHLTEAASPSRGEGTPPTSEGVVTTRHIDLGVPFVGNSSRGYANSRSRGSAANVAPLRRGMAATPADVGGVPPPRLDDSRQRRLRRRGVRAPHLHPITLQNLTKHFPYLTPWESATPALTGSPKSSRTPTRLVGVVSPYLRTTRPDANVHRPVVAEVGDCGRGYPNSRSPGSAANVAPLRKGVPATPADVGGVPPPRLEVSMQRRLRRRGVRAPHLHPITLKTLTKHSPYFTPWESATPALTGSPKSSRTPTRLTGVVSPYLRTTRPDANVHRPVVGGVADRDYGRGYSNSRSPGSAPPATTTICSLAGLPL